MMSWLGVVLQVLNRSMDPRTTVLEPKDTAALIATTLLPPFALSHLPGLSAAAAATQQIIPGGSQKDCIRLRGLPFEAQVGDIIQFLGELSNDIVCYGVHLIYKAEVSTASNRLSLLPCTQHCNFILYSIIICSSLLHAGIYCVSLSDVKCYYELIHYAS